MKYTLPRQIFPPEVRKIASRAIRQQKIYVPVATQKNLREMAAISETIEKQGLPSFLVRKKLPGRLGYGIFLHPKAKPILKGDVIAPYAGTVSIRPQNLPDDSAYAFCTILDIHLSKQEQRFFDPKSPFRPNRAYSLDLDAVRIGNFTRFINHSEKPNILADFLRIPKNRYGLEPVPCEIVYIAKKLIRPGEQLLVCYEGDEKSYWSAVGIKPFPMTPKTFQLDEKGFLISDC